MIVLASCKKEESNSTEPKTLGTLNVDSISLEKKKSLSLIPPADGKYPVMTFTETEYDFGDINQGDKVEHTFEFKNTGETDLVIIDAKASCGCTVPEYTKTAIKPEETGKIKVTFNSSGKQGETVKTITVMCNTVNKSEILKIKTNILVPSK
jgi:hypothetical protein